MQIIPAVATAFTSGLIMGYLSWPLLEFLRKEDADFESDIEVLDLLAAAIDDNGADRALLLVATNGGKKIQLGSHKFASVLLEPANSMKPYVKPDFQKYLLDDEYLRMLAKVKQNGHVPILTESMPEGLLKRRYMAEGITAALVFKIHSAATQFYYVSFETKDPAYKMLEIYGSFYTGIEAKVNKTRNLFK